MFSSKKKPNRGRECDLEQRGGEGGVVGKNLRRFTPKGIKGEGS